MRRCPAYLRRSLRSGWSRSLTRCTPGWTDATGSVEWGMTAPWEGVEPLEVAAETTTEVADPGCQPRVATSCRTLAAGATIEGVRQYRDPHHGR